VTGDGAYDTHDNYAAAIEKNAAPCFPPRKNARRHKAIDEAWRLRNHAVSQVHYKGSKKWKQKTNYHRRSLAETAMFGFAAITPIFVMAAPQIINKLDVPLGYAYYIPAAGYLQWAGPYTVSAGDTSPQLGSHAYDAYADHTELTFWADQGQGFTYSGVGKPCYMTDTTNIAAPKGTKTITITWANKPNSIVNVMCN
jgi:hypothetical protein